MSQPLEQLLRQAEAQKLQMEMNLLFQSNLEVFKIFNPSLQQTLATHKPQRHVLHIDPNNKVNLADKVERTYFYNTVPYDFCEEQVTAYKKAQRLSRFTVNKNDVYNPRHIHIPHLNALVEKYHESNSSIKVEAKRFIPNLIVTGVGLGYHIPLLMKEYDIQNIFIYEDCLDTFHASLHTIDWKPILTHFASERRSITLSIGEPALSGLERIESNLHKLGLHNHIYTFLFKHTHRQCETDFLDSYVKNMQSYIGGLGFFDDEQIGLAHGYHNIKNNIPIFQNRKNFTRKTRLLIIGNGPSLDEHKEYLLKNQHDMVIMTCGTAIGSVLKMGIKPDFHVEMERTNVTAQVLNIGITDEDRKGISLLCLHTVPPDAIAAFEEAYCAIKPSDAGTSMVQSYFKRPAPGPLYFCNPTVTNCALAYGICMGFVDIHLIGVDLAFSGGEHHSKNAIHYKMEYDEGDNSDCKFAYTDKKHYEVDGNFGAKVVTHPLLDSSRISLERLLRIADQTHGNITCYNSNHGSLIDKTTPCQLDEIPQPRERNKLSEVASIKKECFVYRDDSTFEAKNPNDFLNYFFSIEKDFRIDENIEDEKALIRELQRLFNMLSSAKDPITHRLMKGSANAFFGSITEHCLYRTNREEFKRNLEIGAMAFNKFIEKVYKSMKEDPFRLDDTENEMFVKLKAKEKESATLSETIK